MSVPPVSRALIDLVLLQQRLEAGVVRARPLSRMGWPVGMTTAAIPTEPDKRIAGSFPKHRGPRSARSLPKPNSRTSRTRKPRLVTVLQ